MITHIQFLELCNLTIVLVNEAIKCEKTTTDETIDNVTKATQEYYDFIINDIGIDPIARK